MGYPVLADAGTPAAEAALWRERVGALGVVAREERVALL
jgi:hypothetical protein